MSFKIKQSLVLLMAVISAVSSENTCTMVPVTDPSSLFDQSQASGPFLEQIMASDYEECIDQCCITDSCNVVVFKKSSQDSENCVLYACHPTSSCSMQQVDEVTQIYISEESLEGDVTLGTTDAPVLITHSTAVAPNESGTTTSPSSPASLSRDENDEMVDASENENSGGNTEQSTTSLSDTSEDTGANDKKSEKIVEIDDSTGVIYSTTPATTTQSVIPANVSNTTETDRAPETTVGTNLIPTATPPSSQEVESPSPAPATSIDDEANANSTVAIDSPSQMNNSAEATADSMELNTDSSPKDLETGTPIGNTSMDDSIPPEDGSLRSLNTSTENLQISTASYPSTEGEPTNMVNNNDNNATTEENESDNSTSISTTVSPNITSSPVPNDNETVSDTDSNSDDSGSTGSTTASLSEANNRSADFSEGTSSNETDIGISTTTPTPVTTTISQSDSLSSPPTTDSSDIVTDIPPNDNITEPLISGSTPDYYDGTTFSDISTLIYTNETFNATQNAAGAEETSEAMTAILICALTFGCVFVVAVSLVLGRRIYDGYKKRHYSRMDYLINGMYN